MNIVQLHQALHSHETWVKSKGITGVRANFTNLDLSNSVFDNRMLSGAIFAGTTLVNARFVNCIMNDVNFIDADLTNCDFHNAVVTKSSFNNSTLTNTNFVGVSLEGSSFTGANIKDCDFRQASLATAIFDIPVYQFQLPTTAGAAFIYATKIGDTIRVGPAKYLATEWLTEAGELTALAESFVSSYQLRPATFRFKLQFFSTVGGVS